MKCHVVYSTAIKSKQNNTGKTVLFAKGNFQKYQKESPVNDKRLLCSAH